MKRRRILLPSRGSQSRGKRVRRPTTAVHLQAKVDDALQYALPTLVFERRRPHHLWVVPPVRCPLYWFDILMVRRKLIVPIPPDHFIVDGRRFKVLAQDEKVIGVGYTRWLVFEEAAVPKGETP